MSLLAIEGLSVTIGALPVLGGVSMTLAAGEVRQGESVSSAAEALLTFFEGAQIVGVIDPVGGSARSLRGQLDQLIDGWAVWGSGSDKGDAEGESRDGAAG